MQLRPAAFDSALDAYQKQAGDLLAAWRAADPDAVGIVRHNHPPFLDEEVRWMPKEMSEDELRPAPFELSDAQHVLARWYGFADWQALAAYVASVADKQSPVWRFEAGVEAVVNGDEATLTRLLSEHPELVRA